MAQRPDLDAIVVGASLAGCTTALLLARAGARVAVVERRPDPAAFKRICGHYIQPSAVPVLERLGLLDDVLAEGGVRGHLRFFTRWGWVGDPAARAATATPVALNLRRERLDPVLRRAAGAQPGVDLLLGHTVDGLRASDGRVTGVELRTRSGRVTLSAPLVVAADGRGSPTAALAGVRTWRTTNVRFAYAGYFENATLPSGAVAEAFFAMPDVGIAAMTDSGLTAYAVFAHRGRLAEFKRAPEQAVRRWFAALPDAPPLEAGRLVGPMFGKLDLTNEHRGPVARGLALAGDAAMTSDPVGAVGCGWALQSAEWLAEAVAPALAGERPLDQALRGYVRRWRRGLAAHGAISAVGSRLRRHTAVEALLMSAAVHDDALARQLEAFGGREIPPGALVHPRWLARAAKVKASRRRLVSQHATA